MKLYTKTGDKGISSLYNGVRISKTSIYFTLLGDLDELNCQIGMAKSLWKEIINQSDVKVYSAPGAGAMHYRHEKSVDTHLYYEWYNVDVLKDIQCLLMDISTFIATPPWHELKPLKGDTEEVIETWITKYSIDPDVIKNIENLIDRLDSLLPPIKNFVIPGNNVLVSSIHICRAIARRCERRYLEFLGSDMLCYGVYESVDTAFNNVEIYLNRLSDFFFVLSRFIAFSLEVEEDLYKKQEKSFKILTKNE